MAVIKEWNCLEHGPFECSHAICPAYGCDSQFVKQEFRTAPKIRTSFVQRFDAGIKKSAEMLGTTRFASSSREGDVTFQGRAQDTGMQVLWGNQVERAMGRSFAQLTQMANQPLTVRRGDGTPMTVTDNNGMRAAAESAGITERRLPPAAERTEERKSTASIAPP